jgi:hypothetical protein
MIEVKTNLDFGEIAFKPSTKEEYEYMTNKFQPTKEELFEIWRMSMSRQVSENEAITKFKKVNGKLVHIWE